MTGALRLHPLKSHETRHGAGRTPSGSCDTRVRVLSNLRYFQVSGEAPASFDGRHVKATLVFATDLNEVEGRGTNVQAPLTGTIAIIHDGKFQFPRLHIHGVTSSDYEKSLFRIKVVLCSPNNDDLASPTGEQAISEEFKCMVRVSRPVALAATGIATAEDVPAATGVTTAKDVLALDIEKIMAMKIAYQEEEIMRLKQENKRALAELQKERKRLGASDGPSSDHVPPKKRPTTTA